MVGLWILQGSWNMSKDLIWSQDFLYHKQIRWNTLKSTENLRIKMYYMSKKHTTFILTLIKSEFLVQIVVSILFAGSYVLMHANLCNCASSCKMLAYCRFCRWISCIIIYLCLFSECSQTLIEFSLFTASHGGTSGVAIYCGWQYIDIFHSMEFLFTGFHGCYCIGVWLLHYVVQNLKFHLSTSHHSAWMAHLPVG